MATNLDASHRVGPPLKLNLCHPRTSRRLDHPLVPRNGREQREQEAWQGKTFSLSLMARCVVGKGQPCIRRNDAPNTMGRCVCSMPLGSLTVAPVPYASTASASSARAAAFVPFSPFPSSHSVGGLVTLSASPSLDRLATQPLGHGGSPTRFTTCLDAFTSRARSASALAHDLATTARTQCPTTQRPARRDYRLWALNGVCPGPRIAGRLS